MGLLSAMKDLTTTSSPPPTMQRQPETPIPLGGQMMRSPLRVLAGGDGDIGQRQLRYAYRSTVALLMNFRAQNFAPHLADCSVERRAGEQDTWEEVEPDHPWVRLLRRPNNYMPPRAVWQWLVMCRDGVGHADFLVVPETAEELGVDIPGRLLPVWPEMGSMQPIYDDRGAPRAWRYHRADGQRYRLPAEAVVRVKRMHPVAPWRTASLIEATAFEIDQDLAADVYSRDSMREQGLPDVMLETNKELDPADVKRLAKDFGKQYRAGARSGRSRNQDAGIPVSHSGMQIKPLNLSKRKEEFSKQREFIKTVLFQNWEMNQALFSQEPNRANIEGAQYGFALHTIEPNVVEIAGGLEFELERVFGADPDALRLSPPDDIVPEDRETRAAVDQTEIESGVTTINEVRERDGKDPVEGGDESLVSVSVQPLWQASGLG